MSEDEQKIEELKKAYATAIANYRIDRRENLGKNFQEAAPAKFNVENGVFVGIFYFQNIDTLTEYEEFVIFGKNNTFKSKLLTNLTASGRKIE